MNDIISSKEHELLLDPNLPAYQEEAYISHDRIDGESTSDRDSSHPCINEETEDSPYPEV